jgi:hypothetical protein
MIKSAKALRRKISLGLALLSLLGLVCPVQSSMAQCSISQTLTQLIVPSLPDPIDFVSPKTDLFVPPLDPTGGLIVGIIDVTAPSGCAWPVLSDSPWIEIVSIVSELNPDPPTGNGRIRFQIHSNFTSARRVGHIFIGDQTFTVSQGGLFIDVPTTHPFYSFVSFLSAYGITLGCGNGLYCVDSAVSRAQMAAFIMRSLGVFDPPIPMGQTFSDVPPTHPFFAFIEALAAQGITLGCGPGIYCPSGTVSRGQMAAFIIRALGVFNPPVPMGQTFADVPPTHPFFAFIEEMAARGITQGCGGGNYCPESPVTRGQMAVFLVRAFNLSY